MEFWIHQKKPKQQQKRKTNKEQAVFDNRAINPIMQCFYVEEQIF